MSVLDMVFNQLQAEEQSGISLYYNNKLAVFKPASTVSAECCFNCYHFTIPSWSSHPRLSIDETTYSLVRNTIFPINPGQVISCSEVKAVQEYIAFFMDRQLIEETSDIICRKPVVSFSNKGTILSSSGLSIIGQFINESINKQIGYEFILESLSMQLAITLLRELESSVSKVSLKRNYPGRSNICEAINFLKEYYNSNFTLEDIARAANLSPYHFIKVFKAETGRTPFEYLMDIKIEKARDMLKSKRYSINEISHFCGFINSSHFSTVFKKNTGISPSQYRKVVL